MDKDGVLSVDELASLVGKIAEREGGVASFLSKGAETAGAEDDEALNDEAADAHGNSLDQDDDVDENLEDAKMIMEENDADGDGKLSTQDVLKLVAPGDGEESNTGLGRRQFEQLIAGADMDNDGGLSVDELAFLVGKIAEKEGAVASLVSKGAETAGTEEDEALNDEAAAADAHGNSVDQDDDVDENVEEAQMSMEENDADGEGSSSFLLPAAARNRTRLGKQAARATHRRRQRRQRRQLERR